MIYRDFIIVILYDYTHKQIKNNRSLILLVDTGFPKLKMFVILNSLSRNQNWLRENHLTRNFFIEPLRNLQIFS